MKTYQHTSQAKLLSKENVANVLAVLSVGSLFLSLLLLSNCGYYYKVREVDDLSNPDTQAKLNLKGKYVILRNAGLERNLYQIDIKDDIMSGQLRNLAFDHRQNLNPEKRGGNRYKKRYEADVVKEVHIFLNDYKINIREGSVSFPLSSIEKVQVYSKDGAATSLSWILPPVLTIGVIAGIVAASSCPFVYTFDGANYELAGELYGGATYPALERHDFLPLPELSTVDGKCVIKISNELREIQHTNLCEMLTVEHPNSVSVLLDKAGKVHTIQRPEPPKRAITTNGSDVTFSVLEKGDFFLFAFDDDGETHHVNGLVLTFAKENDIRHAKLIVRAKNSSWSDYAFGKFTHLFGSYYDDWESDLEELSTKKLKENALVQDIPLSIYIGTDEGWNFVDFYEVVGPIAYREMVVPIDLSDVVDEKVKIKLETGYRFWDLDYVALDYSENIKLKTTKMQFLSATDENGTDVKTLLQKNDKKYLVQPEIGNEAILEYAFAEAQNPADDVSFFLHSKGFYKRIRSCDHQPNWLSLIMHKHNHAFSKYSFNEYQEAIDEKMMAMHY